MKNNKQFILILLLGLLTVINSCNHRDDEILTTNEPPLSTKRVSTKASEQKLMLQDGESDDLLLSGADRGFYLKAMLQVKKKDKEVNKFIIRNFLPHTFKNVEVYYKLLQ